jgi:NADH:ubiquinone oxidoreductase subunit B-like Fe-S oxidoreductase
MSKSVSLLAGLAVLVFISGCGPDMNLINQATTKAETDVSRAQTSAQNAEQAAQRAQAAAQKAEANATEAQASARKASDGVARLEAMFATSVTK